MDIYNEEIDMVKGCIYQNKKRGKWATFKEDESGCKKGLKFILKEAEWVEWRTDGKL